MKFQILRLVSARFSGPLLKSAKWNSHQDDICVKPLGDPLTNDNSSSTTVVFVGFVEYSAKLDSYHGEYIAIPDSVRQGIERRIEDHCNLLSVHLACKRSLSSPDPYIAIHPLDEESREWLSNEKGIWIPGCSWPIDLSHSMVFDDFAKHLLDRMDGVRLMAEALAQEHPTGQFISLIRVIERAFATRPDAAIKKKLPSFMQSSTAGVSETECERWADLRHQAVHAYKENQTIAHEADIRPHVTRLKLAAYEVLLNKANWFATDTDRRDVWVADSGPGEGDGHIFLTKGKPAVFEFTMTDGYGSYPMDTRIRIGSIAHDWFFANSLTTAGAAT